MAVNWLWKSEKGWYTLVQTHTFESGEVDLLTGERKLKTVKRKFKIGLYGGNCLAACIYRYKAPTDDPKDIDPKTGKPRIIGWYSFSGFWNDIQHVKNCLGMSKDHKDNIYKQCDEWVEKIHLNVFYPEMLQVAKLFAKAGIRVELYYKEIK